MNTSIKENLSKNIQMLLNLNSWSRKDLARKAGISSRMVTYIINQERAATIEVAESIGKAFGVNGWVMISPNLTPDSYKKIETLTQNYINTSPEGRDLIDMIADREARYTKIS